MAQLSDNILQHSNLYVMKLFKGILYFAGDGELQRSVQCSRAHVGDTWHHDGKWPFDIKKIGIPVDKQ